MEEREEGFKGKVNSQIDKPLNSENMNRIIIIQLKD